MPVSTTSKALREQLRAPAARIRQLADLNNSSDHTWTAENEQEWTRVNAEYDGIVAKIDKLERAESLEAKLALPSNDNGAGRQAPRSPKAHGGDGAAITDAHRALAFQAWMAHQSELDLTEEQEEAAALCGVNVRRSFFSFNRPTGMSRQQFWSMPGPIDFRAALSHQPQAGGYTIPEGFINSLEINMLAFGGVRQVASIMTTTSGEPMPWPTTDDTSNVGRLIGENAAISTTATSPTFGAIIFNAYMYTSDFILVPYVLMQDSAFNLAQVVGAMCGERIGRITSTHFTTGTGISRPKGITNCSGLGVTTASGTAIAADEILDLVHSVDPAYRSMGCGFLFHDGILKAVRKLKDGQGRYLWQQGMSDGAPNMLWDYPYTICQEMQATIATGTKTMLFGQLNKYKIRDVSNVRLKRLDERYADNDQVAFVALSQHDGNLLDAGTNPVKHMLQA